MKPHYWRGERRGDFLLPARKNQQSKDARLSILEDMFRVIEKAPVLSNKGFGADKRT